MIGTGLEHLVSLALADHTALHIACQRTRHACIGSLWSWEFMGARMHCSRENPFESMRIGECRALLLGDHDMLCCVEMK